MVNRTSSMGYSPSQDYVMKIHVTDSGLLIAALHLGGLHVFTCVVVAEKATRVLSEPLISYLVDLVAEAQNPDYSRDSLRTVISISTLLEHEVFRKPGSHPVDSSNNCDLERSSRIVALHIQRRP